MKIPSTFPLCFNKSCPRSTHCLRYVAGMKLSDTKLYALSVLPHLLRSDGDCPMFRDASPIKVAYGFSTLFSNVRKKDIPFIREKLMEFLGSQSAYYRYNNGKLLLTPVQQERIYAIFSEYGYQDNLHFDDYSETYDFTD